MNFKTVLSIGVFALLSAPAIAHAKVAPKKAALAIAKAQQKSKPEFVVVWDIDDVLYTRFC